MTPRPDHRLRLAQAFVGDRTTASNLVSDTYAVRFPLADKPRFQTDLCVLNRVLTTSSRTPSDLEFASRPGPSSHILAALCLSSSPHTIPHISAPPISHVQEMGGGSATRSSFCNVRSPGDELPSNARSRSGRPSCRARPVPPWPSPLPWRSPRRACGWPRGGSCR